MSVPGLPDKKRHEYFCCLVQQRVDELVDPDFLSHGHFKGRFKIRHHCSNEKKKLKKHKSYFFLCPDTVATLAGLVGCLLHPLEKKEKAVWFNSSFDVENTCFRTRS